MGTRRAARERKPAQVIAHPTRRRRAAAPTSMSGALDRGARDVLVALRAKLAARIDDRADVSAGAFGILVRQFLQVNDQLAALDDAAAWSAPAPAAPAAPVDDAWDESKI
jgi:hypothetical protein